MMQEGQFILSLVSYQSGKQIFRKNLDSQKMLLGRFENADITIDHPSISHYHALIILTPDGHSGVIKDLASENGIKVNDQSGQELFFSLGDRITLGAVDLYVEETITDGQEKVTIINRDKFVKKVNTESIHFQHELKPKTGLELIDGEYCDITFDESKFNPTEVKNPLLNQLDLKSDSYIDIEENKKIRPNLIKESGKTAIEVSILSNGHLLSVHYLPIANRTYYACSIKRRHSIPVEGLLTNKKIPFIHIANHQVEVYDLSDYFVSEAPEALSKNTKTLKIDDVLIFTIGTTQIFIRQTQAPAKHRSVPFFQLDKLLLRQLLITFVPVLILAIVLKMVDITPPKEEPKKIAILYRPAVQADMKSETKTKENADKKDADTGIKEVQQKETLPQFAAKNNDLKKPSKTPEAAAATSSVAPAKVKAYEFKSDKFNNLFASQAVGPNLKESNSKTNNQTQGISAAAGELNSKELKTAGTFGQDSYGNAAESYGAKGLSTKSGADTAYVAPKTVILGSMDPELLRKILREYLPQFKHCYQEELDKYSDHVKGTVNLDFRIGEDGLVKSAAVQGTQAKFSTSGQECMRNVLRRIAFPKPKGGGVVDVRQPLNFFSERTKM